MLNLDYLYNPNSNAAKRARTKNFLVDKKLGFSVIENGTILPQKTTPLGGLKGALGGIVNGKGKYIGKSFVKDSFKVSRAYVPSSESIQHRAETVIYIGMFYPVWGHVLTDNISRLWFLESDYFKNQFKDCPLVYIPWSKKPLEAQKSASRLLEILGFEISKFQPITQPTQFEKIILPDRSFSHGGRGFTKEYIEMIDRARDFALKNRTPTSAKKVYYFHGRRQFGEERLAEYFKSKGYEIVRPETLTFDEQLNLLINCESFASTVGSISHNSIFLRDNTEVILIPRAANRFISVQSMLDQIHEQNLNYVDSSLSVFYTRNGPFCYIVSDKLKKFFGDKFYGYEEKDFTAFLDYIKRPLKIGLVINPKEVEDYGEVFLDFMSQLKQREDLIANYDMLPGWEKLRPVLTYQTHVHKDGWCSWQNEEKISNPLDKKYDIQAIKINFPGHKVYYSVYYNDGEGWSEEVIAPEQAGIAGKRKSIFGIKIRLDEDGAKEFDILYRVHKFDGKWTPWAKNGEELISDGIKLNAIQIKLDNKRT